MTVVDTSVFVDALFRFNEERSSVAGSVFEVLQEHRITILEPEIFKIELIGQLVRRIPKQEAIVLYEEIVDRINFVEFKVLNEIAFSPFHLLPFRKNCRNQPQEVLAKRCSRSTTLRRNNRYFGIPFCGQSLVLNIRLHVSLHLYYSISYSLTG